MILASDLLFEADFTSPVIIMALTHMLLIINNQQRRAIIKGKLFVTVGLNYRHFFLVGASFILITLIGLLSLMEVSMLNCCRIWYYDMS